MIKVYNEDKTAELLEYDIEKGYLQDDVLEIKKKSISEQVKELREQGYSVLFLSHRYCTVINGEFKELSEETEQKAIKVYIPYTEEELFAKETEQLRERRKTECFSVINRGKLWYDALSLNQLSELEAWYHAWLNVTETREIPSAPLWINNKIITEVI